MDDTKGTRTLSHIFPFKGNGHAQLCDNRVAVGLHVKRARVYVCDRDPVQEEGGRQQQPSAFVRRPLLAASRREFHLFARRNEMALIVWRVGRGGAGKQGPRDDGERNTMEGQMDGGVRETGRQEILEAKISVGGMEASAHL